MLPKLLTSTDANFPPWRKVIRYNHSKSHKNQPVTQPLNDFFQKIVVVNVSMIETVNFHNAVWKVIAF